jgi:hypothetical protein
MRKPFLLTIPAIIALSTSVSFATNSFVAQPVPVASVPVAKVPVASFNSSSNSSQTASSTTSSASQNSTTASTLNSEAQPNKQQIIQQFEAGIKQAQKQQKQNNQVMINSLKSSENNPNISSKEAIATAIKAGLNNALKQGQTTTTSSTTNASSTSSSSAANTSSENLDLNSDPNQDSAKTLSEKIKKIRKQISQLNNNDNYMSPLQRSQKQNELVNKLRLLYPLQKLKEQQEQGKSNNGPWID